MNALAFGMILTVVGYAGCDSGVGATTTGSTASVTNGTGYHPGCNGGVRDGFCNALGADPETCDCLDCVDTAYCKGGCKNDGVCNPSQGEDCTCIDCVGKSIPDGMGGKVDCYGGMGSGPATSSAAGGGSGPASSSSSTKAATTATSSTQAATTTAASTTASTAASTTASSTSSGGGG